MFWFSGVNIWRWHWLPCWFETLSSIRQMKQRKQYIPPPFKNTNIVSLSPQKWMSSHSQGFFIIIFLGDGLVSLQGCPVCKKCRRSYTVSKWKETRNKLKHSVFFNAFYWLWMNKHNFEPWSVRTIVLLCHYFVSKIFAIINSTTC